MSTFEDWLDEVSVEDGFDYFDTVGRALNAVRRTRKEMVCANCVHYMTEHWNHCTRITDQNGYPIEVEPDFYCKSFTMKGEE